MFVAAGGSDGGTEACGPDAPDGCDAGPAGGRDGRDLFLAAFVVGSLTPLAIVMVAWTPAIVWRVLGGSIGAIPWWLWALMLPAWALASVVETARERPSLTKEGNQ